MIPTPLRPSRIREALGKDHPWACDLHVLGVVGSTSDLALERGRAGAREGLVIVAEGQHAGRGRRGTRWSSPPRCGLWVSVLLTPLPDDRRLLAAATGLAVADAVAGLGLVPRIKWPNDILCANRKVAGCLVDLAQDPAGNPLAIAGIGINANVPADAFPETAGPQPVSLHTLTGGSVDRESLLASLLLHLHRWVEAARAGDVDLFRTRWREQDALIGARVVARVGNQRIAGRVLSTDPVDGLHLEDDAGIHHALRAEHSHLDAVDLADVPLPPGGRKSRE